MILNTRRLLIREFASDDWADYVRLETGETTYYYEAHQPDAVKIEQTYQHLQAAALETPRTLYRLMIVDQGDGHALGRISLTRQNESIGEWEIGWALFRAAWGQGYATEAAAAVRDFAFGELKIHRLIAFCNTLNHASEKVMQRIGMRQDGRLRGTLWWQGGWHDEFVYAMLMEDWLAIINA